MNTAASQKLPPLDEPYGSHLRLAPPPSEASPDLRSPELYLNRELTWLAFNSRVLHEARDPRTPLLERVKFLAIVSSNLDEFFMKRIGGLKQQVGAGIDQRTVDGRTPEQQIVECVAAVRSILSEKAEACDAVFRQLQDEGIRVCRWRDLTNVQQAALRDDYQRRILPLVTPLGFDRAHPFPFLSNLSLNLVVTLREPADGGSSLVRVKVPVGPHVPRFIRVGEGHSFVLLEEIIAHNLDLLFADATIESCHLFRVTRNASTDRDEETADDLLAMIEAELRDRRFAPLVRLETGEAMPPALRDLLVGELGLDPETDVFEDRGLPGMADLMELAGLDLPELHDRPYQQIETVELTGEPSIFEAIRTHGSILLQHPYESFTDSVERFLDEASQDEQVLAIKATLYRTSPGTRIISSLEAAALSGKQVDVTIELKARFDEAANVRWARRLEEAGVHVSYGLVGLKTHCKAILVVRNEADGLRRYTHVGTGNYHAGTARMYADVGLLSCDEELGHDIADLFNTLTSGRDRGRLYRKILTAPEVMKRTLLAKIEREIALHSSETPGRIRLKTNALEDPDVVEALYRAGRSGVRVDLLVRDTCRLRPGLAGLSESITVISTVGRFLEHARIYAFWNGGAEEYFIGSADLMQRNLEHRIELLIPVEKAELRAALDQVLEAHIADRRQTWVMESDGSYRQRQPAPGEEARGCQELLISLAQKRQQEAQKRRAQSISTLESATPNRSAGSERKARGRKKIRLKEAVKSAVPAKADSEPGKKAAKLNGTKGGAKRKRVRSKARGTGKGKGRGKTRAETGEERNQELAKSRLGKSRGIDSMLRNAYRAQLSMIALAARKANIMISVNGFLLSLLTISSAYILTTEPLLLVPFGLFLLTCVMAILFAVLAARPQRGNRRRPELEDFRAERADLLVFEQFAKLPREDYMTAMLELMEDDKRVYRAMVGHVHFLGQSAQRRFRLLQISYSAFIIGLSASCLSLVVVAVRHYL